ncbi:jeltraxin-like [Paramisgurnus dabryanus]|uniref:jeltraxin-like n=1 Tax=Paramisgurnus dabryanus TaxID=90735 RepID=UPI0031F3D21C
MKSLASYVLVLLCCGLAWSELKTVRKCLREKVVTFPKQTTEDYVQLHSNETMDFSEITVCLRFYTDEESTTLIPFSLTTTFYSTNFTLTWSPPTKQYVLTIQNGKAAFNGLPFNLNQWNSVCVTWEAGSGRAQMFVNEVPSVKKAIGFKEPFKGEPKIILGQFQDGHFGFSPYYVFTGFISDVHIYKEVLTPRLIKNYMEAKIKYKLGDFINWHNLKYTLFGSVQVEEKQHVTFYTKQEVN